MAVSTSEYAAGARNVEEAASASMGDDAASARTVEAVASARTGANAAGAGTAERAASINQNGTVSLAQQPSRKRKANALDNVVVVDGFSRGARGDESFLTGDPSQRPHTQMHCCRGCSVLL